MYYTVAELVKKDAKTREPILLHYAGPEAQDIHSNLLFSDTEGDRTNEQYKFWQRDQHKGETIDQWVNDLR